MNVLRVGIVGAGGMGSTHARSFARLDGVAIEAIADIESGKADVLAARYGAQAFSSLEALLEVRPDIVVVSVPTDLHRRCAEAAFAAGCHVLVEKPLALTPADADAIVDAADRAGRTLGVGQCVRFFPEYARAKHAVDAGDVGRPAAVRCRRGGGFPTWSPWFAEPERSGGVLFDLGVHEFDWLLWCFGPVARVHARSLTSALSATNRRDYGLTTLRHASGVVSHVESCWADPSTGYTAYEVAGDGGLLVHDSRRAATLTLSTADSRTTTGPLLPDDDPYHRQAADFVTAVRERRNPLADGRAGSAAVRVATAAALSAKTGKVVAL